MASEARTQAFLKARASERKRKRIETHLAKKGESGGGGQGRAPSPGGSLGPGTRSRGAVPLRGGTRGCLRPHPYNRNTVEATTGFDLKVGGAVGEPFENTAA